MTDKTEKLGMPAVIKWTDKELGLIAKQLYMSKGSAVLVSEHLDEIKAKDVLLAQIVLPEQRHRKLISISQNIQALRLRLDAVFQKMERVREDALVLSFILDRPSQPLANTRNPIQAASGSTSTPQLTATFMRKPSRRKTGSTQLQQSTDRSGTSTAEIWLELVRPLVAMACEQFVQALANEVSQRIPREAFGALVQDAMADAESNRVHASQGGRGPDFRYPQNDDDLDEPNASGRHVEAPLAAKHYAFGIDDEISQLAETEVQPLFDPKLPPSANSSFKPTIGVIVTHAHEFQDLQQFYPQLHLIQVLPDAVRSAGSLRDCQRIIGLRSDVPWATDEHLRNTYSNRYVRIAGGIEHVEDQLSSWLNKPGSINCGPGKDPRRYDASLHGTGRGHGKDAGETGNKKRYNRYPRPVR